ncbi:hypothetical protein DOE76_13880 [Leifsonia sp. ku-ls]|nr:hypothetical protein DOE76_13880 [Leifsonia sp. ku-ls]
MNARPSERTEAALEKALALAELGLYVLPAFRNGKDKGATGPKAEGGHGFYNGSNDPATIREMWAKWPGEYVGVWPGPSGIICEDIDVKGDEAGFVPLWQHHPDDYESTVQYPSESGGQHNIFRDPNPVPVAPGKPYPLVDRKAGNSLFLWYGEVPTREKWATLPDAPEWLSGGPASRNRAISTEDVDLQAFLDALTDGEAPADLTFYPEHYDDMKSAIHTIVQRALFLPETPGLRAAYDQAASAYIESAASTVPEESRPKKVEDCTVWSIGVWDAERPDRELIDWYTDPERLNPREPELPTVEAEPDSDPEGSSWSEVDLTDILNGTYVETMPTILHREDGPALFYPGCVNDLHGESESGKSWIAIAAVLQVIARGEHVRYLDFESTALEVTKRLLLCGGERQVIDRYFHYYRPTEDPLDGSNAPVLRDFQRMLNSRASLIVLDGVTEAMTKSGFDFEKNKDVAKWMVIPKSLANVTGAAVVLIDHVIKSSEGRGRFMIGAQHKMAALDGASYLVDVEAGIAKGAKGSLLMKVAKDRPGQVRANSGKWSGRGRLQLAAIVEIDSETPGRTYIRIKSHTDALSLAKALNVLANNRDIVLEAYEKHKEFKSVSAVLAAVEDSDLTRDEVKDAMTMLEHEGLIKVEAAKRSGQASKSYFVGIDNTKDELREPTSDMAISEVI